MKLRLVVLSFLVNFTSCRDYNVGMFKKNDILVASDTVFKEKNPFGFTTAKYGKLFMCRITYFRVSDRLGSGRGPRVKLTRGGLGKISLTLVLTASYGQPIAVNIYVGCENKKITTKPATKISEKEIHSFEEEHKGESTGIASAEGDAPTEGKTSAEGEAHAEGEPHAEGEDPAEDEAPAEGEAGPEE